MTKHHATSRRALLTSTIAGLIAGGAWGAALQTIARPSHPTLSVIGRGDAQIVLLDTTEIRVLVLLGTPKEDLQTQIPALLTMFSQRIDLIIGTRTAITSLGPEFKGRWRVSHTLLVPESEETVANTSARTLMTKNARINLRDGISLVLLLTTRNAWNAASPTSFSWVLAIEGNIPLAALAADQHSIVMLATNGVGLVIVPEASPERIASLPGPASMAINARDDLLAPQSATILVRTYPEDIARFELHGEGIALLPWAEGSE